MLNPHGAGYLVDRTQMEEWLLAGAAQAGVTVIRDVRRTTVHRNNPGRVIWSHQGRATEVRAGLIIGATGRGAPVVGAAERHRVIRSCDARLPAGSVRSTVGSKASHRGGTERLVVFGISAW